MPHADTEDQLVEQPAIGLFAEPGCSLLSGQVELASDSANGARSNQPGATPQATCRKTK